MVGHSSWVVIYYNLSLYSCLVARYTLYLKMGPDLCGTLSSSSLCQRSCILKIRVFYVSVLLFWNTRVRRRRGRGRERISNCPTRCPSMCVSTQNINEQAHFSSCMGILTHLCPFPTNRQSAGTQELRLTKMALKSSLSFTSLLLHQCQMMKSFRMRSHSLCRAWSYAGSKPEHSQLQ